jgi:hypothetical protein
MTTATKTAAEITTAVKIKIGKEYRQVVAVVADEGCSVSITTLMASGTHSAVWRTPDQKVRVA